MIQYALKCAGGHSFDSWFQSAEAFDKLVGSGMVSCAVCGSAKVEKSMMAPRVRPSRKTVAGGSEANSDAGSNSGSSVEAVEPATKPDLRTPASELETAMREMRRKIEQTADYVGGDFAREARAIHNGESPERAIYGEARPDEAKKLVDEGVKVAPLPFFPNRKAN